MTKIQIIAKTFLTVLGIYAVLTLYGFYPGRYLHQADKTSIPQEFALLCTFTVFVGFIAYFMVFHNDRLAGKLAGPGELLEPQAQATLLAKSLRVGLVFTGLMLLPGSVPTLVGIAKTFFLIRPALNEIIISKRTPDMLRLSYAQWYTSIYHLLKAVLAIYLICGAPHFAAWQAKNTAAPTVGGFTNE